MGTAIEDKLAPPLDRAEVPVERATRRGKTLLHGNADYDPLGKSLNFFTPTIPESGRFCETFRWFSPIMSASARVCADLLRFGSTGCALGHAFGHAGLATTSNLSSQRVVGNVARRSGELLFPHT